jgi:major membrane immunogen (membrane-anchored lipoprotein)
MKMTFLRNTLMVSALVAGLSLTSCKSKTENDDAMGSDDEMHATDTTATDTTSEGTLDETGAKDTISVTTDTVKVVKP